MQRGIAATQKHRPVVAWIVDDTGFRRKASIRWGWSAKYRASTLPPVTKLKELAKMAKHRWIIERDYKELKQESGLGHFEGQNWRGGIRSASFAKNGKAKELVPKTLPAG